MLCYYITLNFSYGQPPRDGLTVCDLGVGIRIFYAYPLAICKRCHG